MMNMEHFYDSVFSQYGNPEQNHKSLELPIFSFISRTPKLNTSITEKEEIESLENVSSHLRNEVSTFFAIAKIQEATQHQSVRHSVTQKFLKCIEQIINDIPKYAFHIGQAKSSLIKKSCSFDSNYAFLSNEDEVSGDNEIRVLLETIPYIYQNSSVDEMKEFNKSFTHLINAFAPNIDDYHKGISYFPFFKLTTECINNIFLLAKKTFIPIDSANSLIRNMVSTIFAIFTDLTSKDINKSTLLEISPYFGCLIHLVAEGIDLLTHSQIIIIQQLFVILVICYDDLLSSFPTYSKDLKKIALLIPPMNKFHEVTMTTDTTLRLLKCKRTSDNIALSINRYFDTITVKEVSAMPQIDAILLLTIAVLEKTRSKAGDFVTFFEYFTYDYYPAFTQCLKNLVTPLFHVFISHISKCRYTDQRNADVELVIRCCFRYFAGKNAELAFIVDKIYPELFKKFQLSLFSPETVSAIIESVNDLDETANRSRDFKISIITMIYECLKAAPDFVFALLHSYFIKNVNASQETTPSVFAAISLMPSNIRDKFLMDMMKKTVIFGSAKNLTIEQILKIQNPDERVLHLAFSIKDEKDFRLLMIKEASPPALIDAWSYVMMTKKPKANSNIVSQIMTIMAQNPKKAVYLNSLTKNATSSNSFLDVIIRELIKSMKNQQGLFSAQYNEKMVNFHKAVFKFLYELVSISSYVSQIHQVLPIMKNLIIIEQPPALSGLLQLGLFLASIIMCPPIPPNLHEITFNKFILVIMKIIALNAAPTMFKYIRPVDLPYFNRLLDVFSTIFHYSLYSNSNQNQLNLGLKSANTSSSFIFSSSPKTKNKIDYSINKQLFCYIPDIQDLKIDFIQSQTIFINSLQTTKKQQTIKKLLDFLAYSLTQMFALFSTYLMSSKEPTDDISNTVGKTYLKLQFSTSAINELIPTFWSFCPSSIPAFSTILNFPLSEVTKSIRPYFYKAYPYQLAFESHLAQVFVNVKIDDLNLCELLPPAQSIVLLKPEVLRHPTASHYLVKCLNNFELDEILQYIPQLVQSLRFDVNNVLYKFLRRFCRKRCIFQHYLLWNIQYEKCHALDNEDQLPLKLVKLEGKVIIDMNNDERTLYRNEFEMIDQFEKISQNLLPITPDERKVQLPVELKKIKIPQSPLSNFTSPVSSSVSLPSLAFNSSSFDEYQVPQELYVPSNPNYKIIDINEKESKPLKSAAKVPLLITFTVYNSDQTKKREKMNFACIFKTHDDVRMDAMMIQLIDKFKRIFNDAGIDCYLLPYRVFATGQERGVIECITHAKSRHEIGELTKEDLLTYFIHTYGQVGTEAFDTAQRNFIKSMAPYSLICYLFQIKDRHNANIMIDDYGHVIHIDFGFIFDISPGNNLNFERAPFKLTQEMVNLMGGAKAKPFNEFVKLFTKCFIAVRARYDEIEAIASLMVNAGFPCFRKDSFVKLRQRFYMDSHPSEIAGIVDFLITDSLKSFTTSGYDLIQKHLNNIFTI